MTWNGAGGWVTVSPSLASLPPQHGQAVGARITTRSRGRCAGKGALAGFLRVNAPTVVPAAGAATAASSAALAAASSSCNSNWSSSLRPRSADCPYCSRRSLAISNFRCATIASAPKARASACWRAVRSAASAALKAAISSAGFSGAVVTGRLSHGVDARPLFDHRVSQYVAVLSSCLRPPGSHRIASVNAVKHIGQLRCTNRDHSVGRRRPDEPATLQPFGIERHANAVMPENLDQMTAFATKHIKIAGVRIAAQPLLDLDRQAVHAAPHVGMADRQPYPHTGGNQDHRRANAATTAAAKAGGTDSGIRARTWPANSISIAGSGGGAAMPSPAGATSTRAKPFAAACKSRRQRY